MRVRADDAIELFLAGDVMTGRGVDQILPHPSEPRIFEDYVTDAREYVALAEARNGTIPAPVAPAYPWGDALDELDRAVPFARIVNLETSVTTSSAYLPKGINYRMHPGNVACLSAAKLDGVVIANNHVLDFGIEGLLETLDVLHHAGIRTAGAGRDRDEAERPMIFEGEGDGRLLVYAVGTESSGVPSLWGASESTPGVAFFDETSPEDLARLCRRIAEGKRPRDLVVVSRTGATSSPPRTGASRTPSSSPAWTSCTVTPRTIPGPSRCTARDSSSTAAVICSTTTRASAATRATAASSPCSISRGSSV